MFIAKQVPFEWVYSPIDDTMSIYPEIIITGNKDYESYNNDIFTEFDDDDSQYCYKCPWYFKPEEIREILTNNTGKRYQYRTIRGYYQGDWNYLFYPDDNDFIEQITDTIIKQIETEYFNTGSEWDITDTETGDSYTIYIHDGDPSEKMIAKYVDCIPQELEIHHFTGWKRIANYD